VSQSPLRRLLVHTSHYSIASALTMVAGLISFPLLTRIFSVAEYGVMNLITASLSVATAFGKFGIQHSIVRYQSEIANNKSKFTTPQLHATALYGMTGSALLVTLVMIGISQFAPERWLGGQQVRFLFAFASMMVVIGVVESAITNFLRANQETTLLMKYQVAKKYVGLALIIGTLFMIAKNLKGFYVPFVATELFAVIALSWIFFKTGTRERPSPKAFSPELYKQLIAFGIPMMVGYEVSGIVLAVGDRYVIDGKIGEEPLGLYSAAYNLCQYVQSVVIISVTQAIIPLYMQIWDQKGKEETATFISRSMRTYLLLAAPVIAGLAAVGPELLPALASDKYAGAGSVLPWIIGGMVLDGLNPMVGAGLFIQRRTPVIMGVVLGSAILNIGLNLWLVPWIGILGSAIATLISYGAVAVCFTIASRRILPIVLPWGTLLRSSAAAVVMYGTLHFVYPGHRFITVGLRVAIGAPLFAVVMFLIDADARAIGQKILGRLRGMIPRPGAG
jgi:O-antigen/teichoic acid export membrane protein